MEGHATGAIDVAMGQWITDRNYLSAPFLLKLFLYRVIFGMAIVILFFLTYDFKLFHRVSTHITFTTTWKPSVNGSVLCTELSSSLRRRVISHLRRLCLHKSWPRLTVSGHSRAITNWALICQRQYSDGLWNILGWNVLRYSLYVQFWKSLNNLPLWTEVNMLDLSALSRCTERGLQNILCCFFGLLLWGAF